MRILIFFLIFPLSKQAYSDNVILFLGDGMGISTVTAARIFAGQQQGLQGEEYSLSFEDFEHLALIKTYNTDAQVPDSAGTISAILTGEKTRAGVSGIKSLVERGNCKQALGTLGHWLIREFHVTPVGFTSVRNHIARNDHVCIYDNLLNFLRQALFHIEIEFISILFNQSIKLLRAVVCMVVCLILIYSILSSNFFFQIINSRHNFG